MWLNYLSVFLLQVQTLNRWYDHGEGIGGNVIDLVCSITKGTVKETLRFLEQDQTSFYFQQRPVLKEDVRDSIQILHARPIRHYGLLKYLFERKISILTASAICMEVHYLNKGRKYFAIGLENNSGGMPRNEITAAYFKRVERMDIT